MEMQNFRVVFIRHGITRGNTEKLYCGSTDVPILELGRQDILQCKDKGYYPPLNGYRLYTTGLKRTIETKELIYPDAPYTPIPELNEMDFGDFEMRTHLEMEHLPEYQAFINDKSGNVSCPNGDSALSFYHRCIQGFKKITDNRQDAIFFGHAGTISVLMMYLFPGEKSHHIYWQPNNGRGFTVLFENDKALSYEPLSDDTYLHREEKV